MLLPDTLIIAGLESAKSIKAAAKSLGVSRQCLHARCKSNAQLRIAYRACSLRGYKSSVRGAAKHCALCGDNEHNRQNCPKRVKASVFCDQCAGLPWRRPRGKRRLCACDKAYAPEPPPMIAQQFERPNYSRREVI